MFLSPANICCLACQKTQSGSHPDQLLLSCSPICSGCLGELDHFREGYERPIKQGQRKDAKPHEILRSRKLAMHLKTLIDKKVLRRDKRKISDQVWLNLIAVHMCVSQE